MIDLLTIVVLFVGGLLCILFPLFLLFVVSKKANRVIVPAVAGLMGFFVMQIIIRLPLIQLTLPKYSWYVNLSPVLLALFLAFTAGLFETVGRYWSMKLFMKNDTRFSAGIAHGIGHGGVEAVLLVGFNFILYGFLGILINQGVFEQFGEINGFQEFELLETVLTTTPWYDFLWGVFERILTIIVHIGLSVIMILGFRKNKRLFFGIVLGLHTIIDFTVVLLVQKGVSIFWIEFFILLVAISMVIIIKVIYNDYKNKPLLDRKEEAHD